MRKFYYQVIPNRIGATRKPQKISRAIGGLVGLTGFGGAKLGFGFVSTTS